MSKLTDFFVSTAFRHRLTAVCIPVAIFAIDQVTKQFVSAPQNTADTVVVTTLALAVLGYLRGKVAPA